MENKTFTKNDLKDGMMVEIRRGDRFLILGNRLVDNTRFTSLDTYTDDLKDAVLFHNEWDIVKVYQLEMTNCLEELFTYASLELIWEREKEVDWSEVPVDTKVLVRSTMVQEWEKRHFAKYEDGYVYTFDGGRTSFTCMSDYHLSKWDFAKLAEEEN